MSDVLAVLRQAKADTEKRLKGLTLAIAALQGGSAAPGRGNRQGKGKKRVLSAAARKAMSEAGKRRWSKVRKAEAKS